MNTSFEFLNNARETQQVGSRVAYWTKNIFVHSWCTYPTIIPYTVSIIIRREYNDTVTLHALVLQANHERLRLKCVEWRQTSHIELLANFREDMRDKVCAEFGAALSDDSDDGWNKGSDSD